MDYLSVYTVSTLICCSSKLSILILHFCFPFSYWLSKFGSYVRGDDNVLLDITMFKKSLINEYPESEKKVKRLIGRAAL